MNQRTRENLNWIQGVILGVAASMDEDAREKKELMRSAVRVIESLLHEEEEEDDETQND